MLRSLFLRLWHDDAGGIVTSEYLFLSTALVIGVAAGIGEVRDEANAALRQFNTDRQRALRDLQEPAERPARTRPPQPDAVTQQNFHE